MKTKINTENNLQSLTMFSQICQIRTLVEEFFFELPNKVYVYKKKIALVFD